MKHIAVASDAVRHAGRIIGSMILLGAGEFAHAAGDTPFAAPAAPVASGAAGGTLRVTLAMIVVLAAVLAVAWLTRRLRGVSGAAAGSLTVLAQVPLGTRERAVLLRVGDRQLLIGVAPGSVRTLHVLDAGAAAAPPDAASAAAITAASPGAHEGVRPSFKSLLLKSLGK